MTAPGAHYRLGKTEQIQKIVDALPAGSIFTTDHLISVFKEKTRPTKREASGRLRAVESAKRISAGTWVRM
jgi:hypothetical protein